MAERDHFEEGMLWTASTCEGQFPDGCGGKTVDYSHTLNVLLASALLRLYRHHRRHGREPVNVRHDLHMTFHEWENFQKLRYFGLVEKSYTEEGKRIRAHWHITDKGIRFATNVGYCYPKVWTWRGEPIEFEGEPVSIEGVAPEVWQAEDYARESRPHEEDPDA